MRILGLPIVWVVIGAASLAAAQGSEGTRNGSEGTRNGSEGTRNGSEGTRSGSEGTRSGSEGTRSGSEGTRKEPKRGASDAGSAEDAERAEDARGGGEPRYLPAMRRELESLGVPFACEAPTGGGARCTFRHRDESGAKEFLIRAVYSDETDTIYMYVHRYLLAPLDHPDTPRLLRRLMELNWTSLAGKFEWNPATGEVRLSMLMHTDSNFDRRAFRSLVRTLQSEAERWWVQLARMIGQAGAEQ